MMVSYGDGSRRMRRRSSGLAASGRQPRPAVAYRPRSTCVPGFDQLVGVDGVDEPPHDVGERAAPTDAGDFAAVVVSDVEVEPGQPGREAGGLVRIDGRLAGLAQQVPQAEICFGVPLQRARVVQRGRR